jgi:hypothetical protein
MSLFPSLSLITAVSSLPVFQAQLARSPCVSQGTVRLTAYMNAGSAAEAFNPIIATADTDWLVWVHQDVFLPEDWAQRFAQRLHEACSRWPALAVAGVYGISGRGSLASHAGHVLDRGQLLAPGTGLPCTADSLDELLVAVRTDSGLRMDAALGFDFYGTDLVLQARAAGLECAIVDACCEHWSDTPRQPPIPTRLAERIARSGRAFEEKWVTRLPVTTTCFAINSPGDVEAAIRQLAQDLD